MADASLYAEGSIYYYENKTNTKQDYSNPNLNHDFLVSRPVFLLNSDECFCRHTVNVLVITSSSNRDGIPININETHGGTIIPYAIYSVHKKYLAKYMGRVNNELLQEVKNAVKYHLGFSNIEPEYVKKIKRDNINKNEFIKSLNPNQKSIYDFINEKCDCKKSLSIYSHEMFEEYMLFTKGENYIRKSDYARAFNLFNIALKMNIVSDVDKSNNTFYKGIGLKRVSKYTSKDETKPKKERKLDFNALTEQDLIDIISQRSLATYKNLSIEDKIRLIKSSSKGMNISIERFDIKYVRRLAELEIHNKKENLMRLLSKGASPFQLNSINRQIIQECKLSDLRRVIAKKYLNRKNINSVRNGLYYRREKMTKKD